MTVSRTQPGITAAIDYGPAPNDCDITPARFWTAVAVYFAGSKLLLILGVIS